MTTDNQSKSNPLKPHIVIVGSGFGGTYVAKRLAKWVKNGHVDVTIINKTNYFLFTPLLHEVATGSLSPRTVAEAIREVFVRTGIEFLQGNVASIDHENKCINVATGASLVNGGITIDYDYLVIATGATTNYYGISGAERNALPLKDLSDAARIRSRIIDCFEAAAIMDNDDERARLLSFAVIGGGPTGVETVSELSEFVHSIVDRYCYKTCGHHNVKVYLIHSGADVLDKFSPAMRDKATARLRAMDIDLKLGRTVMTVSQNGFTLDNGEVIKTGVTIWAAGVKPMMPEFAGTQPEMDRGRLKTDSAFNIVIDSMTDKRIFALGDVASYVPESQESFPMLAQVAVREARTVADNIIASINEKAPSAADFKVSSLLVSIGSWFAIGEFMSKIFSGRFAWWVWRTVYLFKFASRKKRVRLAFEWAISLLFPRDITKLT